MLNLKLDKFKIDTFLKGKKLPSEKIEIIFLKKYILIYSKPTSVIFKKNKNNNDL